jgi:hypothetical protein
MTRAVRAGTHPHESGNDERVPRLGHAEVERICQGVGQHRADECDLRSKAIRAPAREESGRDRGDAPRRDGRACHGDRKAATEVQVKDEERRNEAIAEEVHEHAELEEPNRSGLLLRKHHHTGLRSHSFRL